MSVSLDFGLLTLSYSDNLPYTYCEQIGKEIRDISDEIPFDIPDSWEWCRLSDILLKLTDGTHSTPKYIENGVPFISVKDVSTGKLNFSNCKYISEKEHIELYERCNPEIGDILLTKVGTTGIPVIVDTERQFSLFVSVALLKFNQELIYNRYLMYMINSPLVQKQAIENTKGVGNKNWVMRDIANTLIVIPPIEEQKRIVAKIEELLPYIEEYDKAETRLTALNEIFPEMLKKSILQEAVQGKLVPQDPNDEPASVLLERIKAEKQRLIKEGKIKKDKHESAIATRDKIPYEIPDSWEWCRLADICQSITDGDHQPPPQVPSGKPFIVISNVSGGIIDFSNTRYVPDDYYNNLDDNRKPIIGDIMFTVTGSYGIVMKVDTDREFCFQRHIALLKPLYVDSDFLVHWLRTPLVFEQCKATATGTAQKTVGLTSLKNIIIPLPPLAEQHRIVAKIEEIMPYINTITK